MDQTSSTWNEPDRLAALDRYHILDTQAEAQFDDIVRIAAQICGTPMALISLVDASRQWFKAAVGINVTETPREIAFCAHAIQQHDILVVNDAAQDARFADNPLVTRDPRLRFYAGAPLETPDGFPLGTLCVLDSKPGELSEQQGTALKALARQVMTQLELRLALHRIRVNEERHTLILNSAIDYAIISMDLAGLVTSWNEGARRILGWTEAEMCGRPCDDFFTPEDRANKVPEIEMGAALKNGRGSDERYHIRKDGSLFWASGEMMPLRDGGEEPVGFLKILRDRTDQRRAEAAVNASQARAKMALEAADLGTWETSPNLGELRGDARTQELFGLATDEPLHFQTTFLERVHPSDRAELIAKVQDALGPKGDGLLNVEYRTNPVKGAGRWVHVRGRLVSSQLEGQRFMGTVRDASAEKEAEEQRKLLTHELEHRIKNTMAVVQAIVNQTLRHAATPQEARETIGNRLQILSRAHDMLTRTSWSAAPILEIIAAATQLHGTGSKRIRVQGSDIHLKARAALTFSLVLHELLTNALKYGSLSNDLGVVDISWSESGEGADARFDFIWAESGGPRVEIPTRKGFGTRLIEAGVVNDLGASTKSEYRPEGMRWSMTARLDTLKE